MSLLVYLGDHAREVVSKRELMDEVWQANVVEDAIHRAISLLRSALGDSAQEPRMIETIPKRGYRLLVEPEPLAAPGIGWRVAAGLAAAAVVAIAGLALIGPRFQALQRPVSLRNLQSPALVPRSFASPSHVREERAPSREPPTHSQRRPSAAPSAPEIAEPPTATPQHDERLAPLAPAATTPAPTADTPAADASAAPVAREAPR